jgi:tellurite methyltransferase
MTTPSGPTERAIAGFHCDEDGEWVAQLSCGHGQHVRHRPPFQLREWVLEEPGRRAKLGMPLRCPLCDRAELPDGLTLGRASPEWNEHTIPAGLLRDHRIAAGSWGQLIVRNGRLRFTLRTTPELELIVGPDATQAIPPEIEHVVHPLGPVRFSIHFLSIPRHDPGVQLPRVTDEGGEAACFAHLLCPECGAVLDGGPHMESCARGESNPPRISETDRSE